MRDACDVVLEASNLHLKAEKVFLACSSANAALNDRLEALNEPKQLALDDCVEYIANDELVEVTPVSVRILKNAKMDKKAQKQAAMKK